MLKEHICIQGSPAPSRCYWCTLEYCVHKVHKGLQGSLWWDRKEQRVLRDRKVHKEQRVLRDRKVVEVIPLHRVLKAVKERPMVRLSVLNR